jgi:hypothetical protein
MTNKTKLLPCPCCEGEAKEMYTYLTSVEWVACLKCGLETKGFGNAEAAAKAWNTRAAPAEDVRDCPNCTVCVGSPLMPKGCSIDNGQYAEDVRAVVEEPVAYQVKVHGMTLYWNQPSESPSAVNTPLYRHPQRPVVLPERLREVWLFLDGRAELNGCVFGEKPEGRHNFWWRKELRAVLKELYPAQ